MSELYSTMYDVKLIDSHCHLDFPAFDTDREQVLQRALDCNICDIVIPGTQSIYWHRIKNICDTDNHLHACYGLHPYWADKHQDEDIDALVSFIDSNKPVAVGECGLDFRKQHADKETQLHFLEAQFKIACNRNLPVVVHAVNATETIIQAIKKFKGLHGMIHSYSGSSEQAGQLIDLNFLISINGSVTFDNAKKIKQVVRETPLTSLLVETDAPDQADQNNIGKRNEPAYLINTVRAIAELKQTSINSIAEQTTANAKTLFGI
ncbi:MAG: TatD family hydrolase [Gammaproteobacteria bacterium]|nr:TatD family hydrolase [Gammaproteobacteria bacterium]